MITSYKKRGCVRASKESGTHGLEFLKRALKPIILLKKVKHIMRSTDFFAIQSLRFVLFFGSVIETVGGFWLLIVAYKISYLKLAEKLLKITLRAN